MKRLMLIASLAIVAAVVAPVASASAATELVGSCTITGEASFTAGGLVAHLPKLPTEAKLLTYKFENKAIAPAGVDGTHCTGTVLENAIPVAVVSPTEPAKADVHGEGLLSCPASIGGFEEPVPGEKTGAPGEGKIEVTGLTVPSLAKKTYLVPFKGFKFVAVGTNVNFVINEVPPGSAATGTASFAADIQGVRECGEPGKPGPSSLEFAAAAAGKIG
jgi:hypothetical protein